MSNSDRPLITVITVCYNSEKTIEKTIQSVIGQTYRNIEYIIIDGLSSDGTVEIIKKYQDRIANWVSEMDNGIYDAMNKGISLASGDLIGIINSDDWYETDAIENIVKSYLKYPSVGVFHGLVRYISHENLVNAVIGFNSKTLGHQMIQHPTCFVNKKIYNSFGKYNLAYRYASDYEFMLRVYSKAVQFHFMEVIIANFREGGISYSIKAQKEDYFIKYKFDQISILRYSFLVSYLNLKNLILKLRGSSRIGFVKKS